MVFHIRHCHFHARYDYAAEPLCHCRHIDIDMLRYYYYCCCYYITPLTLHATLRWLLREKRCYAIIIIDALLIQRRRY